MKLTITNIGSSSTGNCTVISNGKRVILVDMGFSPKYTKEKLLQLNLEFKDIHAVLVTHNHSDHIHKNMLNQLDKLGIPVYCQEDSAKHYTKKHSLEVRNIKYIDSSLFEIPDFAIQPFAVPHDSEGGCCGYSIFTGNKKVTIATDLAYTNDVILENFCNSDAVVIESNHDLYMLRNSSRPMFLINRIINDGHLSNEQCAEFVYDILNKSKKTPQHLIFAHLSGECNTRKKVEETMLCKFGKQINNLNYQIARKDRLVEVVL